MDGQPKGLMTVDAAIEQLTILRDQGHGDIPVVHMSEGDGGFYFEFNKVFEMLGIPDETGKEHPVCALTCPIEETQSVAVPGSHLKLIKPD
jgi:hypothetical protein